MEEGVTHENTATQVLETEPQDAALPPQNEPGDVVPHDTPLHDASEPSGTPHPLEPGGDRFKQVYARAKEAEQRLQAEREARARAEGELEAIRNMRESTPATPSVPEYSWSQLQGYIDEGKISMAQALEYREAQMRREAERKAEEKVKSYLETTRRHDAVQQELAKYKEAIPEAIQVGTPERQRLEQEFRYLVGLGYDSQDPKTEILAARAAFGDPSTIKQRKSSQTIPLERGTMQDTHAPGKPKPSEKDPLTTLTPDQKKHYQRMIDRGVYPNGWADVKNELTWRPGT